jgi:hypothetical protein
MSKTQPSERASGGTKPMSCPKCGQPMRLASVEPHRQFTNLDVREFVCDCGGTISDIVQRA